MLRNYKYEPNKLEVFTTEILGSTVLQFYYKKYIKSLELKDNEKILDFCCGSGSLAKNIKRLNPKSKLFFSDISIRWHNLARIKLDKFSKVGSVSFSSLIDSIYQKYDRIIVHFVIHDFPNKLHADIFKVLIANCKSGGVINIREPLNDNHGFKLFQLINQLESLQELTYDYEIRDIPLIGKVVDVLCCKK